MINQQIADDLIKSLKERNTVTTSALRLLKARIQQDGKNNEQSLSDEAIIACIRSQIKRHKEAAESFKVAGRNEKYDEEMNQAVILTKYLPIQIPPEQIEAKVKDVVEKNSWNEKDFGKAMKLLRGEFGQLVDGGVLSAIVKKILPKS